MKRLTSRQVVDGERMIDRQIDRQVDRYIDRQIDRLIDRQINGKRDELWPEKEVIR